MQVEVKIPQQGLTTDYVTITEWKASVGDIVEVNQVIATMESEKSVLDLEAPAAGKLVKICVEESVEVEIGKVVAVIETF